MSPKEADFPLAPKKECLDRHDAILKWSSLLELKRETLIFYFVITQKNVFEENFFTSRLRSRVVSRVQLENNEEILRFLCLDSCNYITSSCFVEDNHLDILDWTVLYMQDLLRYNPFLENVFGRYPYQDTRVNEWFQQFVDREDEPYEVKILNRKKKKQKKNDPYPLQDGQSFPDGLKEDGYSLFYHGTDHDSAVNILENGIDLEKGKVKQDFCHRYGFYLNNDYQGACLWAGKMFTEMQAVLIFKVPNQDLDRLNSLDLTDNRSEWKRITKTFRFNPSHRFVKRMSSYSFIEGPMARLDADAKETMVIRESYQLCILSDKQADVFDSYLHSIVFF